jgi:two-component sensor histidine kinase/CHASE3 domain sensor protein
MVSSTGKNLKASMTDLAHTTLDVVAGRRWFGGKRLLVLISLLLVISGAGAALYLVYGVDRQLDDVVHSYDVRNAARDLSQAVTDAETGQRGYLLTGDQSYLAPYNQSLGTITERLQTLEEMTKGDPLQSMRVSAIANYVAAKRDELTSTVELGQAGRFAQAREVLQTDTGEKLMSNIRDGIGRLLALENQRLAERNDAMARLRSMLIGVILIAMGAGAILAYALFTRSQRRVSDITRRQNFLLSENEELEARVKERTAELEEAREHADRERRRVETLLQDSNHRIGNSLATVSSLLGLQVSRTGSSDVRDALEAARSRVQVIASGHRRLRLGDDLETTRADEFLEAVIEDLKIDGAEGPPIEFVSDFTPLVIKARDATTIGILLGELVTNAVKHAFPEGSGGTIYTRFFEDGAIPTLVIEDDGAGMAPEKSEGGLGSLIIKQLARQFGGVPVVTARQGGGTCITLALPELTVVTAIASA